MALALLIVTFIAYNCFGQAWNTDSSLRASSLLPQAPSADMLSETTRLEPDDNIIQLPLLPYDYSALEPVISTQIMELHHLKHHQGYVDNYNKYSLKLREAIKQKNVVEAVSLYKKVSFNGGGYLNHKLFWPSLSPISENGGKLPASNSKLTLAIQSAFGSYDILIELFNNKTHEIQGSGWGWLAYDPESKSLILATTEDQDILTDKVPLLGIDVWEHAYYLQYLAGRKDYLREIWRVVNWIEVEKRYIEASENSSL